MRISNEEISVVVPMYNSEKTILSVLEGICAQNNIRNIKEIIVVNDGSTDNSKKIVEEYIKHSESNIRLINKENGGVSSARNIGMRESTGEWIAFCDSDDIWFKNKLEIQIGYINSNEIDFLGSNHSDEVLRIFTKKITSLYHASVKDLCIKMFPQTSTVIMRKQIFEEIGGFDEKQKYAEDGNYFLKIAGKYRLYYSPEKVLCYGLGKRGFGVSGLSANLKEMHKGTIKNLNEMLELGYISLIFWFIMVVLYNLKFIRRILVTKFGGLRNEK